MGKIGSVNGLMPDGTKSLPEAMLTVQVFCGIHQRVVSREVSNDLNRSMCSEITLLQQLPHIPSDNELNYTDMS